MSNEENLSLLDSLRNLKGKESAIFFLENTIRIVDEVIDIEKENRKYSEEMFSEYIKALTVLEHCILESQEIFMENTEVNFHMKFFYSNFLDKMILLFRIAKSNFIEGFSDVIQNVFRELYELNARFVKVIETEKYEEFHNSKYITEYKKKKEVGLDIDEDLIKTLEEHGYDLSQELPNEDKYVYDVKSVIDISRKFKLQGEEQYKVASIKFHSMSYGFEHKHNFKDERDVSAHVYGLDWIFWVIYKGYEFLESLEKAFIKLNNIKVDRSEESDLINVLNLLKEMYLDYYNLFRENFSSEFNDYMFADKKKFHYIQKK